MSVGILAPLEEQRSSAAEGGGSAEIVAQFALRRRSGAGKPRSDANINESTLENFQADEGLLNELDLVDTDPVLTPKLDEKDAKFVPQIENNRDLNQSTELSGSKSDGSISGPSNISGNESEKNKGDLQELQEGINGTPALPNVDAVAQNMPDHDRKRIKTDFYKTVLKNFVKNDTRKTNYLTENAGNEKDEETIKNSVSEEKKHVPQEPSNKTHPEIGEEEISKTETASLYPENPINKELQPPPELDLISDEMETCEQESSLPVSANDRKNSTVFSSEPISAMSGSMAASTSFLPIFHPGTENNDYEERLDKNKQNSTVLTPTVELIEPVETQTRYKRVTFKEQADKSLQFPEDLLSYDYKYLGKTQAVQTSTVEDHRKKFSPGVARKVRDDSGNSNSFGRSSKSSRLITENHKTDLQNVNDRSDVFKKPSALIIEVQDMNDGKDIVHLQPPLTNVLKPPKEVPIVLDKRLYTVEVGRTRAKANKNRAFQQRSSVPVMTEFPAEAGRVLRSQPNDESKHIPHPSGRVGPLTVSGPQPPLVLVNGAATLVHDVRAAPFPSGPQLQNYQPFPSGELAVDSHHHPTLPYPHEINPTTINRNPTPPHILAGRNTVNGSAFINESDYSNLYSAEDKYPLPPIGQSHLSNYERLRQHNDLRKRFQNEPSYVAQQLTQQQKNNNLLVGKTNLKSNQVVRRNSVARNRNKLVFHSNIDQGLGLSRSNLTSVRQNRNSRSFESLPRSKVQSKPRSKTQSPTDRTLRNAEPTDSSIALKKDQLYSLDSLPQHHGHQGKAPQNITSSSSINSNQNLTFPGLPQNSITKLDPSVTQPNQHIWSELPEELRHISHNLSLEQESKSLPDYPYQDIRTLQSTGVNNPPSPPNMAGYGMSSYYGGYGGGAQSYAQPSYNSYGSNYDAGRRRSLGYDQNPSDAYRRRSSSLDYEPGGGGRYPRMQSVADPFADDDDRMSRQRLMEDLDYQIQEKKRLEQMRREKESYEERILDQNVAKQRKQMQEEYQREQNLKRMKEEQRRRKQAAHEAYLASLEQQYRRTSIRRQPSPPDSPEVLPTRRTELSVDPNSEYSAYDSTPVKGKGAYDIEATEKIGPKSKPPISKGKKPPTSKPSNVRRSPTSSSPTSRNTASDSPKAPRPKPILKKSSSPERAKLTPPKEKPLGLERKSNDNNNNLTPSKMDMSMTISDVPKRRKLPSSDDRYDFGLNLNQASRNTLQAQKDGNPFFDSKPGRRRKTPDPRVSKNDEKPSPPSPQPRSLPNYLQPTPPPSNPRSPSPRISMDSEVQTSDFPEERPERGRSEARSSGVQTQPLKVENGAQTYDDFEPERPPTPKLRPKPFDWRIKLDETTGDWRKRQEQDSKKDVASFEEQHKDLASQLKAMKRGLKGEAISNSDKLDTDYKDHTRSRSSDNKGAEGGDEEAGRRRPASSDGSKGRSDGQQKRSDSRNNRGDLSDDLIDLENTDRTVLGAYLNKTGSRSGQKSGPGEDGRRSGGYTPSTGDKTRIGTPETDRDSAEGRNDSGEKRTNSGNWDETPNFLRRKEPFDLEATDRTLLTNYVDRNRRQ